MSTYNKHRVRVCAFIHTYNMDVTVNSTTSAVIKISRGNRTRTRYGKLSYPYLFLFLFFCRPNCDARDVFT